MNSSASQRSVAAVFGFLWGAGLMGFIECLAGCRNALRNVTQRIIIYNYFGHCKKKVQSLTQPILTKEHAHLRKDKTSHPYTESRMVAYSFCGLNEADPRASSEGREGTEAIPLGDVC
ncbi:unnamed protein product [Sphenostylis stenocarpa]|uniref:Uncharacterized protein n=1 Tax=Sphenostylis stenocarpa TaxID=92480 RepID=A0AA86RR87_9FABA|nr:unnamed protein product [Sphenostylis stenocarpa]